MDKKYSCSVIKDLLPLYQDEICSEESRAMVQEHLAECEDCAKIAARLKDSKVENTLYDEKTDVLRQHAKEEKKRSTKIGMITAAILMIPTIVCLICNLAVGHALDWFFIVFVSLLVFASLSVVPMIVEQNRILWTLGSFTITLTVLLGVINLYTNGHWFFLTVVPTLFGLTVFFLPLVLYKAGMKNSKGILSMLVDTIFLYGMLFVLGSYYPSQAYNRIAYGITTFCAAFIWICFLIIRYLPISAMRKAGIVTILSGIFLPYVDRITDYFVYGTWKQLEGNFNLLHWTLQNLEEKIYLLITCICFVTGIVLFVKGKKKTNE